MNRAQEIKQKRLNERKDIDTKHDLKIKAKVEEMFNWVLDMLDAPTENNTKDEVHLSNSYGSIRVGYNYKKGLTEKPFEPEVMKQLVEMFEAEDGYTCEYFFGIYPRDSCVTIKIE